MNTQRALVVFSAVMLVLSVALAIQGPRPESLVQFLAGLNPAWPSEMQARIVGWFGPWAWSNLAMPLLRRPAWLPPACLALLAIGLAVSLAGRKTTHRSRRRS